MTIVLLRTDRAWVVAVDVQLLPASNQRIDGIVHPTALIFAVVYKNTGDTPAIKAQLGIQSQILAINQDWAPFVPPEWPDDDGAVVGPRMAMVSLQHAIGEVDYGRLRETTAKLILYSSAKYVDIFSPKKLRHSEACFEITINGTVTDSDGRVRPNFFTKVVGPQNRAT